MTRGERNNNPGNIRTGCPWVGIDGKKKDSAFCVFVSMKYGVRALIVTLRTYVCKHRLHTIEQIISAGHQRRMVIILLSTSDS